MLFAAASTYMPGEPGQQGLGESGGQNVNLLGRFNLAGLRPPNPWIAIAGLLVLAWLAHRYLK